jgi:sporulation protein YlmC with PRC-barrel domain
MDQGNPTSYLALSEGTDVVSSDGEVVGTVQHVLADPDADVFDGLVVDVRRGPGGLRFADADQVDEIYERSVVLNLAAAQVDDLHEPAPQPGSIDVRPGDEPESGLQGKLRRAWDLISGNY